MIKPRTEYVRGFCLNSGGALYELLLEVAAGVEAGAALALDSGLDSLDFESPDFDSLVFDSPDLDSLDFESPEEDELLSPAVLLSFALLPSPFSPAGVTAELDFL